MSRARDLANLGNNAGGLETLTVSDITDITATASELNKLDGVTATKDELNLVDGSVSGPLSHRNMIINGAMQVAQRGPSSTGVTSGGYHKAPDRFTTGMQNIGTYTISQSTDAPAGFAKSYKIDCTTADASPSAQDNFTFETRLEGHDLQSWKKGTSSALPVTLSFWVKSNKTGNGQVNLRDLDNSRQCGNTYTISSANTWEYKTITFPADTTGAFGDDNNNSLRVEWWIDSGSNFKSGTIPTAWVNNSDNQHRNVGGTLNLADSTANNWYITGVQLELGSVATPFEHKSYAEELARCQRYFISYGLNETGNAVSNAPTTFRTTTADGSNSISGYQCFADVDLPVRLRTGDISFTPLASFNGSGTNLSNVDFAPFVSATANAQRICIQKGNSNQPMGTNQTVVGLCFNVSAEL